MATIHERELERKFEVDRSQMPKDMGEPWVFLQAHWTAKDGKDHSLRLIPSCGKAYRRVKDKAFGVRDKRSTEIPMEQAVQMLHGDVAKNIAFKYRYMLLDGRGWLIDHHPEHDKTFAETEFNEPHDFWSYGLDGSKPPAFVGKDRTFDEESYTRNLGRPRTAKEIQQLIKLAMRHGCKAPYNPDALFKREGRDGKEEAAGVPLHPVT